MRQNRSRTNMSSPAKAARSSTLMRTCEIYAAKYARNGFWNLPALKPGSLFVMRWQTVMVVRINAQTLREHGSIFMSAVTIESLPSHRDAHDISAEIPKSSRRVLHSLFQFRGDGHKCTPVSLFTGYRTALWLQIVSTADHPACPPSIRRCLTIYSYSS